MNIDKKKILIICGATAVGKTTMAIDIANHLNGEIVSCDSMQIYKYMDIGSAKPTKEEQSQAVHHLIDIIDPREEYSVAKYKKMSEESIDKLLDEKKLPIIAGGTGLYLNSILYDMDFAISNEENPKLREELYAEAEKCGKEYVFRKLEELDKDAAKRIHPNNLIKVIRAIEVAKLGKKVKNISTDLKENPKYEPIIIVLDRNREELYERINRRVDLLMQEGLLNEVKSLLEMGLKKDDISMKAIGYKEIISYIDGEISLDEAIYLIKRNSRHYAKRQLTWFRRYENAKWINLSEYSNYDEALEEVLTWSKKQLR